MNLRLTSPPLLVLLILAGPALAAPAAPAPAASFTSAQDAANALFEAAKSGDTVQLEHVLGPGSAPLITSGDPVLNADERQQFVVDWIEKHDIVSIPTAPPRCASAMMTGRCQFLSYNVTGPGTSTSVKAPRSSWTAASAATRSPRSAPASLMSTRSTRISISISIMPAAVPTPASCQHARQL